MTVEQTQYGRALAAHMRIPLPLLGLLPLRPGVHAAVGRPRRLRRPAGASAALAGRPGRDRQAGRASSAAAPPPSPWFPRSRRRPPRSRCCSGHRRSSCRCLPTIPSTTCCARCCPSGGRTRRSAGRTSGCRRRSTGCAASTRRGCGSCCATGAAKRLPEGYDVDTHFNPAYDPWDQRMCMVPDGDFFAAIRSGKAEVVTDHIEAFTESGIRLRSGARLEADVIVTATGLNLLPLGAIGLTVDGEPVLRARARRLQGHDARRRAQPGVRDRLHQRLVDPQGGPGCRVRQPPAAVHGGARVRHRYPAPAGRGWRGRR